MQHIDKKDDHMMYIPTFCIAEYIEKRPVRLRDIGTVFAILKLLYPKIILPACGTNEVTGYHFYLTAKKKETTPCLKSKK